MADTAVASKSKKDSHSPPKASKAPKKKELPPLPATFFPLFEQCRATAEIGRWHLKNPDRLVGDSATKANAKTAMILWSSECQVSFIRATTLITQYTVGDEELAKYANLREMIHYVAKEIDRPEIKKAAPGMGAIGVSVDALGIGPPPAPRPKEGQRQSDRDAEGKDRCDPQVATEADACILDSKDREGKLELLRIKIRAIAKKASEAVMDTAPKTRASESAASAIAGLVIGALIGGLGKQLATFFVSSVAKNGVGIGASFVAKKIGAPGESEAKDTTDVSPEVVILDGITKWQEEFEVKVGTHLTDTDVFVVQAALNAVDLNAMARGVKIALFRWKSEIVPIGETIAPSLSGNTMVISQKSLARVARTNDGTTRLALVDIAQMDFLCWITPDLEEAALAQHGARFKASPKTIAADELTDETPGCELASWDSDGRGAIKFSGACYPKPSL